MKSRRKLVRSIIIVGLILAFVMALNWFMTYRLESFLREQIRVVIKKATDNVYDFTFSDLQVGLLNGELIIKDLSLFPDTTVLDQLKLNGTFLPDYYNINIGEIDFSGINLTWLFNYRKLHFKKLSLKNPDIKIVSAKKYGQKKRENKSDSTNFEFPNLYEFVSPYFDYIKIDEITLKKGNVSYFLNDNFPVLYKLDGFDFKAHHFALDENSDENNHLLYSEYFDFNSGIPQTIYESDQFLFTIDQIIMSTRDSVINVGGAHFRPQQRYLDNLNERGDRIDAKVNQIEINKFYLDQISRGNNLNAGVFRINTPQIEYLSIKSEDDLKPNTGRDSLTWSLYDLVSPIFAGIYIDTIDFQKANLEYKQTSFQDEADIYKLNNLNVTAEQFKVDSTSHEFNFFYYVQDFILSTDSLVAYVPSKNSNLNIGDFRLDTKDKQVVVKNIDIKPIQTTHGDNYTTGGIGEINMTGLVYTSGIAADLIEIKHPKVKFILNKIDARRRGEGSGINEKKDHIKEALQSIAPYINAVNIDRISIEKGELELVDNIKKNTYKISDLYFSAKNFRIDQETELLQNYMFVWDEYILGFKNFDNVTPDFKYRLKIKEANFNSTQGDLFLKEFSLEPNEKNLNSYVRVMTPFAKLQGLDQKQLVNKKILFKTLTLESPVIEAVSRVQSSTQREQSNVLNSLPFDFLLFDQLYISTPNIFIDNIDQKKSIQVTTQGIQIDNLKWEVGKIFNVTNLVIDKPYISLLEQSYSSTDNKHHDITFKFEDIVIDHMDIKHPSIHVKTPTRIFDLKADAYLLKKMILNTQKRSVLQLDTFLFKNPSIVYKVDLLNTEFEGQRKIKSKSLNFRALVAQLPSITNEAYIDFLNIDNLDLNYENIDNEGNLTTQNLKETSFSLDDIRFNRDRKVLLINDIVFRTKDYTTTLADSLYTIGLKGLYFSKARKVLDMDSISLVSNIPKFEFSYGQNHQDWFNLTIDKVRLSDLDIDKYIRDSIVFVGKLQVQDVLLQNFKNNKIVTPPKKVPLLYQIFQKIPVKYYVDSVYVNNFSVIYDELEKNSFIPGLIGFTNMNGRVQGFTNLTNTGQKFYELHANGKAFGEAPFKAVWTMPIDSMTNQFYLSAQMSNLDLRVLNALIRPMAPIDIKSGKLLSLDFNASSSDVAADVEMRFIYDKVYVDILKSLHSSESNFLATQLVNHFVLKSSNLEGSKLRLAQDSIIRDPYHSNFNYFWQMLRPPLIQSVGVGKGKQQLASRIQKFIYRLRHVFDKELIKREEELNHSERTSK